MIGIAIALAVLIGLRAVGIRFGAAGRTPPSWSPPSDWRERDPRS
jgi:hypothetical protein